MTEDKTNTSGTVTSTEAASSLRRASVMMGVDLSTGPDVAVRTLVITQDLKGIDPEKIVEAFEETLKSRSLEYPFSETEGRDKNGDVPRSYVEECVNVVTASEGLQDVPRELVDDVTRYLKELDLDHPIFDIQRPRCPAWVTKVDLSSLILKMSCMWLVGRNRQRRGQLYAEEVEIGDWVRVVDATDNAPEGLHARVTGRNLNGNLIYIETADEIATANADEDGDYRGGRWIHVRHLERERFDTWEAIAEWSRREHDLGSFPNEDGFFLLRLPEEDWSALSKLPGGVELPGVYAGVKLVKRSL